MNTVRSRMRMGAMVIAFVAGTAWANNLTVTNVTVLPKDSSTAYVKFDVAWQNAWYYTNINHDAAWVFFKVQQEGETDWQHVRLEANQVTNPAGYSVGSGTNLDFFVPPDKVGMFVRRKVEGAGAVASTNVQAVWNFTSNNLSKNAQVKIQAFAVEMAYVAQGAFWAGNTSAIINSSFHAQGSDISPIQITSTNAFTIYWGAGDGTSASVPAGFPKGYAPFYCMKYEITEGQWVDFFNLLDSSQKSARDITGTPGKGTDGVSQRNTVAWSGSTNLATTVAPDRACNFLAWSDIIAFSAWAGLRPMTELEFEKACRGPLAPLSAEFAWGDGMTIGISGLQGTDGSGSEYYTTGNSHFMGNGGPTTTPNWGAVRAGIFAKPGTSRSGAGASYWGIMELSGNLTERPVTVGHATGRAFTGLHGNGTLTAGGDADVTALLWPALNGAGAGQRGGAWRNASDYLRVADRIAAITVDAQRGITTAGNISPYGGRGVRSAP